MIRNKAYLQCYKRQEAQTLWRTKLEKTGFFKNLPTEWMDVADALGRVTASSSYAKQSVPHYNGAAMDGIAVWAQDTFGAQESEPKRLAILTEEQSFVPGGCYMIDTGDALPEGTNAVIMIEDVHVDGAVAEVIAGAAPWQHVRIIGEDIVANELVMPEYQIVTPVDIAALLIAGVEQIQVVKKPRVAVLPTGDELVATCRELKPGNILDVNSYMLAAAVREWGGIAETLPIARDDRAVLEQAITTGLASSDMVIVSAGTSAGRDDYTAEVMAGLGEVFVHGVSIKPGRPVVLAICQGKPVIGLPGYPVSSMLTAELFVRDILLARQKLPQPEPVEIEAALVKQVASTIGVEEYVRVSVGSMEGKLVAAPLSRGAGLLSSLTKAQGVICVEEHSSGLAAGATLPVTLLRKTRPERTILAVGSHDLALEVLGIFIRRQLPHVSLACANVGSMGGLMAIRNNEAHIAGVHLLDAATGVYNTAYVEKFLPQVSWQLVHMAMRQQGLLVLPGNPRGISSLNDLDRPDVTFINRQRGSGTRMLLDYELAKRNISTIAVSGYEKEVGTHMAVAASVAAGAVDTGLGVQAAAAALGLDFIPVAQEQYDLLLHSSLAGEEWEVMLAILRSAEFRREVEALGGYDLKNAGNLVASGLV